MTSSLFYFSATHKFIAVMVIAICFFSQCNNDDDGADNDPTPLIEEEEVPPPPPKSCTSCTYVIPASKGTIDGAAGVLNFKPGDTICLDAALKYSTLTFKNIVGTEAKPIIITNCGGTVNIKVTDKPFNLKTATSKYFRITGGDTEKYYGIKLSGSTSNGIVLTEFSTNFEVDHVEVSNVGFAGIMAKTDPTCDDATVRGNFTMRDVSLHHNYVHDTKGECFYIGHTYYGGYDVKGCGVRLPHTIEGIDIYKNRVLRSGWDGIQLSCATKDAAVFNNTVENFGVLNEPSQQDGILIGGGSNGLCYGNFVNSGTGTGITLFGLGDNTVYNNIVMNAGKKGMLCDERGTATGQGFKFINNTIINSKAEGIAILSETLPKNVCINNIIVNPGTAGKYVISNAPTELSDNYTTSKISDVKFVDASTNNFRLQSSSPAVDKGKDISTYDIELDFYQSKRLNGAKYDIGASEY